MRSYVLLIAAFFSVGTSLVYGQGGKAEPRRIVLAAQNSSAVLKGTLRNGQEMDYVFAAVKGQTVTIKNATSRIFDFRVFNEEHFDEGDFDSSPSYSFEIPETADYLFTVRKKIAGPRSSRFSLTITIK
ncbi:MAG: hypothetical protein IPI64_03340 [Chloracidobacterium sp.]|nr:hypothetical protein [Chloracidobacterium sp.]